MIECSSLLGPYIQGFLSYREALFHKNSAHEPIMKSLDRFCAKRFPCSAVLTQEMVLTWMEGRFGSPNRERTVRGSVIRKFAMYMNGIGGAAYVLPEKMYGHTNAFAVIYRGDDVRDISLAPRHLDIVAGINAQRAGRTGIYRIGLGQSARDPGVAGEPVGHDIAGEAAFLTGVAGDGVVTVPSIFVYPVLP